MIEGIHHVALIVSSEESIDFYKRLGFKERFRTKRDYDTVVLLIGYGFELETFVDANHPPRATVSENMGLRHIALKVDNIEETAKEIGLEIESVMRDWVGIRFAYVKDPDGLPLELHE